MMTNSTLLPYWAKNALLCVTLLIATYATGNAQPIAPDLGTAKTFGAFSGAGAIESTGPTVVVGNIGTNAGAFTGFPPGIYTGEAHIADAAALAAKDDLLIAYNLMNDATHIVLYDTMLNATMGNGQVLTSRTYYLEDLTTLSGEITFDAEGDPDAVFVIKINAALNVSSFTKVLLANNAKALNIYWFVGGAVSVLDSSVFKGTIVADGAIHFYGGSSLEGSALAVVGAVTLAGNSVSGPNGFGPADGLNILTPVVNENIISAAQNYQITWYGTGIALVKILDVSLDSGSTWTPIDTISSSGYAYSWNVPDTVSNNAMVRITDANGLRGVSKRFKISPAPSLSILTPSENEQVIGGTLNYQITWNGRGIGLDKFFDYSTDNGSSWIRIGSMKTSGFAFGWSVPEIVEDSVFVRITDGAGLADTSSYFNIIAADVPGSLVVIRPALIEAIIGGTQNYQISWTGVNLAETIFLSLSLDSGITWTRIATTLTDTYVYSWDVPDTVSSRAFIRVTDQNGVSGTSGMFSIISNDPAPSSIIVFHPLAGEEVRGGYINLPIAFTAVNTTDLKTFEYTTDGGLTWVIIGSASVTGQIYSWPTVPNVATTQAMIRITDANGVRGISAMFTIRVVPIVGKFTALTLTGLDDLGNMGNNRSLGIAWTYSGSIGSTVEVEYSLDYTATWVRIATVSSDANQATSWMTPRNGFYHPVFIRVTSNLGMTRASLPFSIGSVTSVASEESAAGYSVVNYPNPTTDQTFFEVTLPTPGNVSLSVYDQRGVNVGNVVTQQYDAGTFTVPFNTSSLTSGVYTFVLTANGVRVAGKLISTK